MFDLSEKRMVWIPVRWPGVKVAEGDGVAENTEYEIECHVELLDKIRLREVFYPERPDDDDPDEEEKAEREVAMFLAVVHDWRKVKNGEASAPFNEANARKILRVPMFASGFEDSYIAAWSGQLEIREKNSVGSSATGAADGRVPKRKARRR